MEIVAKEDWNGSSAVALTWQTSTCGGAPHNARADYRCGRRGRDWLHCHWCSVDRCRGQRRPGQSVHSSPEGRCLCPSTTSGYYCRHRGLVFHQFSVVIFSADHLPLQPGPHSQRPQQHPRPHSPPPDSPLHPRPQPRSPHWAPKPKPYSPAAVDCTD